MSIGGVMDGRAMARLHFTVLLPAEQAAAVGRLAASGHSVEFIADVTGLPIAKIERVLSPDQPTERSA